MSSGLRRIEEIGDTYEPGTEMWRGYQRSVARLEDNANEDSVCKINVDFEALCEGESPVDETDETDFLEG